MDLSGLTSVTNANDMLVWLAENCLSPIKPKMSGTDFGIIMEKIITVTQKLPTAGTAGQVLTKKSDTDFDVGWQSSPDSKISYNFYQSVL